MSNYRLALNQIKNDNYVTFYVNFALIGQINFNSNLFYLYDMGSRPCQTKN